MFVAIVLCLMVCGCLWFNNRFVMCLFVFFFSPWFPCLFCDVLFDGFRVFYAVVSLGLLLLLLLAGSLVLQCFRISSGKFR